MMNNNSISFNSIDELIDSPYITEMPSFYRDIISTYYFIEEIILEIIIHDTSLKTNVSMIKISKEKNNTNILLLSDDESFCELNIGQYENDIQYAIINPPLLERNDSLEFELYTQLTLELMNCNSLDEYRETLSNFKLWKLNGE